MGLMLKAIQYDYAYGIVGRSMSFDKDNKAYHAQLLEERRRWKETHTPPEPGKGIDGYPLMKAKKMPHPVHRDYRESNPESV